MTDYASLIEPVARRLRGEPNAKASKPDELRFGTHGSLKVVPSKGVWSDHETNKGGGTLDLIIHDDAAPDRAGAHAWLVAEGFIPAERDMPRRGRPSAKPEVTYDYVDADGVLVFQVVRKEDKRFTQRRPDPDKPGNWLWNLKGVERVLYRLPELMASSSDKLVFVVEGEKDCDRLRSLGLVATTNAGGAGKWTKQYSEALKGRRVVVVPDNDDAGRDHAEKVVKSLKGTATSVQVLELADLPEKGDVSDWLDAGHTSDELVALVKEVEPEKVSVKEREPSQTDALVSFVHDRFDLAHDENRDGIAIKRDTCEVFRLNSRSFKDGLLAGFQRHVGKTVRDANLSEALMNLQATARTTGEPCKVNLRVGHAAGEYYIDLGKPGDSRTIRLTPGHWEITDRPQAMFVRGDSMLPMVEPVKGGDVNLLWRIANIPEDQRLLVLAWLIDCLRPDTPNPLLELIGEQGSGKSVASEAMRRIIDPNAANLRAEPKSAEDLFVIAHHNHIVAFENVSRLTSQQQDAACILATGGGFAKRKLYSDTDEVVINLRRPVMINGIVAAVTQQDLVDRAISIECPVIEARLTSVEMWREFDYNLPRILGGLLDLAAKALALISDVRLPAKERPRLAEYAILGCAVAMALGRDQQEFMDTFNAMRAETVGRTLEASPVAVAIQEWIEENPYGTTAPLKSILAELERYRPVGTDAWPRSAKGLGDALRRAAPALRTLGVECRSLGRVGRNNISWSIKPKENTQNDIRQVRNVRTTADESADMRTSRTSFEKLSSAPEVI